MLLTKLRQMEQARKEQKQIDLQKKLDNSGNTTLERAWDVKYLLKDNRPSHTKRAYNIYVKYLDGKSNVSKKVVNRSCNEIIKYIIHRGMYFKPNTPAQILEGLFSAKHFYLPKVKKDYRDASDCLIHKWNLLNKIISNAKDNALIYDLYNHLNYKNIKSGHTINVVMGKNKYDPDSLYEGSKHTLVTYYDILNGYQNVTDYLERIVRNESRIAYMKAERIA